MAVLAAKYFDRFHSSDPFNGCTSKDTEQPAQVSYFYSWKQWPNLNWTATDRSSYGFTSVMNSRGIFGRTKEKACKSLAIYKLFLIASLVGLLRR